MRGNYEMFVELNEMEKGNIAFGDNSLATIKRIGKILICLKNRENQYITNVYYIPNIKMQYIKCRTIVRERFCSSNEKQVFVFKR